MSAEEKIEKINAIEEGGIEEKENLEPIERVPPNKDQFDRLLGHEKLPEVKTLEISPTAPGSSLMDLQSSGTKPPANVQEIVSQTKDAVQQIDDIKGVLNNPDITVKRSFQEQLSGKLSHIDESLKIALAKTGIEYTPAEGAAEAGKGRVNPISRFLSFLTDGQWQLEKLGSELQLMSKNNKELSPINMLAVQVKMGQIQQELELFSSLLNNGLQSIKTVMNIQV